MPGNGPKNTLKSHSKFKMADFLYEYETNLTISKCERGEKSDEEEEEEEEAVGKKERRGALVSIG